MIAHLFMIRIFILVIFVISLISCTTYTPSKTDVKEKTLRTDTEIIAVKEKTTLSKISFRSDIEKPKILASSIEDISEYEGDNENVDLKYAKYSHKIIINADKTFNIPLYKVEKAIIEKTTTIKSQSQYSHNPIGSLTTSILMLGSIEAWCLLEWSAQAIPGEQTKIFMEDCKKFYVGDKKKTTEVIEKKLGAKPTGKNESRTDKLKSGDILVYINGKKIMKKSNASSWNSFYIYDILSKAPSLDEDLEIVFKLSFKDKETENTFIINQDVLEYEKNLFKIEEDYKNKKELFNKLKKKIGGALSN